MPVDFRSCNNRPVGLRFQHNSPLTQWANSPYAARRGWSGLSGGYQGQRLVVNSTGSVRGRLNPPSMAFIAIAVVARRAQRSTTGRVRA